MTDDIETYRVKGGWANRVHGTYTTQAEAAEAGQRIARTLGAEWFLRARNGRWRLRNTYGHDPRQAPR